MYQQHDGLFLVHSWRASSTPGQVADIAISLYHHPDGLIPTGLVRSVTYELGPKFFDHPVVKVNEGEDFRLEVSAYGPMLCLAHVQFVDGRPSLDLYRYIDFPRDEIEQMRAWEEEARAEAHYMSSRGL